MRIQKAVITAAGQNQRALPLQTLIDRDGQEKSVLWILIEQALAANVEEICVVVWPGDETRYAQAAGDARGRGALCAAAAAAGLRPRHLLRARVYRRRRLPAHGGRPSLRERPSKPCAHRLVELAEAEECSVSGVQPTRESLLPRFGTVAGRRVPGRPGLYRVDTVIEKPTPTEAEQRLMVPGIRAGYYLCFFGIHVLTPTVMELLGRTRRGRYAFRRAGRTGAARAVPGGGRRRPALRPRRALRPADGATGAGAQRAGPRQVLAQLLELLADREMAAGDER